MLIGEYLFCSIYYTTVLSNPRQRRYSTQERSTFRRPPRTPTETSIAVARGPITRRDIARANTLDAPANAKHENASRSRNRDNIWLDNRSRPVTSIETCSRALPSSGSLSQCFRLLSRRFSRTATQASGKRTAPRLRREKSKAPRALTPRIHGVVKFVLTDAFKRLLVLSRERAVGEINARQTSCSL